eukprot:scaffold19153_cov80-Skeletonema_menzelii.AAC.15
MDNNETPTISCTRLSLTTLADEVWTLFTQKQQKENTPNQLSNQSTAKESTKSPTPKKKIRSVNFQYPVITKTHHRPMTEEQDLKNLFFTEQEMKEMEDDRNATKFTDDVEVLAEGQDWDETSLQSSQSGSNLSIEEGYVPSKKHLPVKLGTVENGLSPRSKSIKALSILSERNNNPRRKKMREVCDENHVQDTDTPKIVQGVQIMLREKSNDLYLM